MSKASRSGPWLFAGDTASREDADAARAALPSDGRALAWLARGGPVALAFDARWKARSALVLPFAGLALRVPEGTGGELSEDGSTFVLAGDAVTFGAAGAGVGLDGGRVTVDVADGRVRFEATLGPGTLGSASVRYFFPKQRDPFRLGALRYPIFTEAAAPVAVRAVLDPTDPSRSRLLARPSDTPLPTSFRSPDGRAITLAAIADRSFFASAWDPEARSGYTVLGGDWRVGLAPLGSPSVPAPFDLMLGLSGLEYAKVSEGSVLTFVPGAPAYAPAFLESGASARSLVTDCPGSEQPVTTTWVYPREEGAPEAAGPLGYYSQPEQAGLYVTAPADDFLRVLELRAGTFPKDARPVEGAPAASFPCAPYAAIGSPSVVNDESFSTFQRFEIEVLQPLRRDAIAQMDAPLAGPRGLEPGAFPAGVSGPTGPTGPVREAVTPQGLLSTFSPDLSEWRSLLLARADRGAQALMLTSVRDRLQEALLSNQLFLVVSSPERLLRHASVTYRVTDEAVRAFAALSPAPPPAVVNAARRLQGELYFSRAYFEPEAVRVVGEEWAPKLVPLAENAELTIGGWRFVLAPHLWDGRTVLVLKFADRDLASLLGDLSQWTMRDAFNDDAAAVQKRLLQTVADARVRLRTEPELAYFVDTVLADRGPDGSGDVWNGVLVLDATVPTATLPPQLRGLAAGIDAARFRAHHLGVAVSSIDVRGGRIGIADSSVFGLIDYADPSDLVYAGEPYAFKVLALRVLFQGSAMASFVSQIQLLVSELFGEDCTLTDSTRGNNLVLDGVWQHTGGEDVYTFTQRGHDLFAMGSHVLDSVLVSRAQFATIVPPEGLGPGSDVGARFTLWGALRFREIAGCDVFSFGPGGGAPADAGLAFSNLLIAMTTPADGSPSAFAFQADQVGFDPSRSTARPESLHRRFPLQLTGMAQGGRTSTPARLGYAIVDTPTKAGSLGEPWFGLVANLSLGSPGGLAGKLDFTASLLTAWAPGADAPNLAVGLRLPGSTGGERALTIMGPLKLNVGGIALFFDAREKAFVMRFADIALGFLSLKFPPGGRTNALLFGDPDRGSASTALGWYAAYMKDKEKKKDGEGQER
ncbi:MAG: hypothetical protein ABW221_22015 [Vicinamibacteria bacterium]